MASSSSIAPHFKYDVFISFRGSDTRRGFFSHLLTALNLKKIHAFVDYKLKEGNEILPALYAAIEQSQIGLIIFSEDYASSKWCLEELVKITECQKEKGQIIIPIFYNVEPTEVRHQKGSYAVAFLNHENDFKDDVHRWRAALKAVADLSGFHSKNFRSEAGLIEEVVKHILKTLDDIHPAYDIQGLVGINKPIVELESIVFANGSKDIRVIGIWGMGGIGKTTIATVLFNKLCSKYESCYFLANVTKESEKWGIIQLRDKILSVLTDEKDLNIGVPNGVPNHVLRKLRRRKILVVLDDVSTCDQITDLVGGHSWLGPGSTIIVTTRDKHAISKDVDFIYKVKALESNDARKLLNLHAFDGTDEHFLDFRWHNVVSKMVEYAKGIPLALKVLGSFLYGKYVEEWECQLQKLQRMPYPEIHNVLRLSYEGLDHQEKKIFLYIACFFKGVEGKDTVVNLLDACGYSTPIALKTLQNRALITIEHCVSMHDLIREMGRWIVRQESFNKPGEQCHLWDPHDIYRVLKHREGTNHIESITWNMSSVSADINLSPHFFARMDNLKLLRFYYNNNNNSSSNYYYYYYYYYYYCSGDNTCKVHLPEGLEILPQKLLLFHWDNYPAKSFPTAFNAECLVEIRMKESRVEKLWDGVQDISNMKRIVLNGSKQLMKLPDLSKALSLQELELMGCINLLSVHPSIFSLPKLVRVTLWNCLRLNNIPEWSEVKKEVLSSASASSSSSHTWPSNLQYLNLEGCVSLKNLPDSFSTLTSLKVLYLGGCIELDTSNLHILFDGLTSLTHLDLDGCDRLYQVPNNINNLSFLESLSLRDTNVKSIPETIKHLPRLRNLFLTSCRVLQSLPQIPPSLQYLQVNNCRWLERVFTPTPQLLQQHLASYENEYYIGVTVFSFKNCPNLKKDAVDAIHEYVKCCNEEKRSMRQSRRVGNKRKRH